METNGSIELVVSSSTERAMQTGEIKAKTEISLQFRDNGEMYLASYFRHKPYDFYYCLINYTLLLFNSTNLYSQIINYCLLLLFII